MSQLNNQSFIAILEHFQLGSLKKEPMKIAQGDLNYNWVLETEKGKFVLKKSSMKKLPLRRIL